MGFMPSAQGRMDRNSGPYPQTNGKQESWPPPLETEGIRTETPLSLEDGRRVVTAFLAGCGDVGVARVIAYIAPKEDTEDRGEAIEIEQDREVPWAARRAEPRARKALTPWKDRR